jgi:hypothetical protein
MESRSGCAINVILCYASPILTLAPNSFQSIMGSAAGVVSRHDDTSVHTINDLCGVSCGMTADPSLRGIAAKPLYRPSPSGLFDAEVPIGTIPGDLFDICIDGKKFFVRCPPGKVPGDLISFAVGVTSFRTALSGKLGKQLVSIQ